MMIPSSECIPQIAEDFQLKSNAYLILRAIIHQPVYEYNQRVAKYKARVTPLRFSRLEGRIANLEKRQVLVESELTLLSAQVAREYSPTKRC